MESADTLSKICEDIQTFLLKECDLLKRAKIRETMELSTRKSALLRNFQIELSKVNVASLPPRTRDEVAAIRVLAQENEKHFLAVQNGLRSVVSRIGMLNADALVGTYGPYGCKVSFSGAAGKYRKKV